jgi:hypothetical protein
MRDCRRRREADRRGADEVKKKMVKFLTKKKKH